MFILGQWLPIPLNQLPNAKPRITTELSGCHRAALQSGSWKNGPHTYHGNLRGPAQCHPRPKK